MSDIPAGYRPLKEIDRVMAAFAPIYVRPMSEGDMMLGFRVGLQHCNSRQVCHGGVWATMADVVMGINVGLLSGQSGPTISLSLDYLASATIGQWVEARARLLHHSHRIGFIDCLFTADGSPAVRASATFRRKVAQQQDLGDLIASTE